jgi:hypothetical protein
MFSNTGLRENVSRKFPDATRTGNTRSSALLYHPITYGGGPEFRCSPNFETMDSFSSSGDSVQSRNMGSDE